MNLNNTTWANLYNNNEREDVMILFEGQNIVYEILFDDILHLHELYLDNLCHQFS